MGNPPRLAEGAVHVGDGIGAGRERETEEISVKSFLRAAVLTAITLTFAAGNVQTVTAQQVPATKVGVVNIGLVFTNYTKAKALKSELDEELKPLKEQAEKIKSAMMKHKEWLENKQNVQTNPGQVEVSQKALRDGARALEDLDLKARTMVGKKQETQLVQLYREIQGAVQSYAQQNGYHIILGYGDPPQLDPYAFANVNRRMTAMDMGTFVTMYVQTGLDVSNEVLARLNGVQAQPVSRTGP
jgi:Skp family chaperone for outer membrane proteins